MADEFVKKPAEVNKEIIALTELSCHADAKLALKVLFTVLKDQDVMGPADFSHQRCEFFVERLSEWISK